MTLQKAKYTPIPDDDAENNRNPKEALGADEAVVSPRFSPHRGLWKVHLSILGLYTIVFLSLSVYLARQRSESLKTACFLEHSLYSPANQAIEYSIVRFNSSLDTPTPYKGYPSPTLDEAWNRITTNNSLWPIRVPDEDLGKIGKAGRLSNARYQVADGGGSMGSIEVFHQLHCLNMLRKYTYPNDYPEIQELSNKRPKFLRSHIDHCIDIIRQNLMCTADIGVISYDWITGYDVPMPDFDTHHKCRNFEMVLDWVTKNRVHIPQEHMIRIGGEVDLPEWHPPD